MSLDHNEVVSTWMKLSPIKIIIVTICVTIMGLGYYCRDELKSVVQVYVQDVYERKTITDFSFPTRVSKPHQEEIQSVMKSYMRQHIAVGALFAYEFIPQGNEVLYQGRVIITHVTQSGKDLVTRYNAAWLPMNSDKELVEKLLRGNVFYRPNGDGDTISTDNNITKFNLRLMEQDGYICMISVPIIDTTLQVRGYLLALLTSVPKDGIEDYIIGLQRQSVEISQYLI